MNVTKSVQKTQKAQYVPQRGRGMGLMVVVKQTYRKPGPRVAVV